METSMQIWLHGSAGILENPVHALLVRHTGISMRVVGAAGSTNWVHYPVPVSKKTADNSPKLLSILIRYKCDSPTALITNVSAYNAEKKIFNASALNLCAMEWEQIRIEIPSTRISEQGLNVSLGIRFDGMDENTHALEISGIGVELC